MSNIINGKEVSANVKAEIKKEVAVLKEKNIEVGLAVVIVGNNSASRVYVNAKKKACEETGYSLIIIQEFQIDSPNIVQSIETLLERQVEGIIYAVPDVKGSIRQTEDICTRSLWDFDTLVI